MKFSRNLLSNIIDISNISDNEICNALNNIGLEVESMKYITIPKGVVVGKVIEKTRHQDADKLNICKVNIGSEVLQIVCGAKNVEKNQFVPLATIGTKLEHMEIKKSNIRGVDSFGMICSSSELSLPKIEDGIFVLDSSIGEIVIGKELCEYEIFNDCIFEVSVTPNRGDCLSLLGIAMDLSVIFNTNLKTLDKEKKGKITPGIGRILNIQFENNLHSSLCYKVARLQGLKNTTSLKLNLALCDMLSKDALHNIINFNMYITGAIINAYKFDIYKDADEKIILNIKKDANNIEGVYFEDKRLSYIGIGANEKYSANENSSLVIFEASFIPANIISEAIFNNDIPKNEQITYISTRGSSPMLEESIEYLTYQLSLMSNSTIYSSTQQLLQNYTRPRINFKFSDIDDIIGNNIKHEEIMLILKKMDFSINSTADDSLISVIPPLQRQDIHSLQDIAEEILRIKGIHSINSIPQSFTQLNNIDINYQIYKFKREIAKKAITKRFFECVHYLFYQKEILQSYGLPIIDENLDLSNPITNELNTLRTSLIPAMLDSVIKNRNYGFNAIALFEIGSIYNQQRVESQSLAFVVSDYRKPPQFPNVKGKLWDFYSFASNISDILGGFELENSKDSSNIYHKGICGNIIKNKKRIGFIGKLNPYIADKLELSNCFICEVDMEALFKLEIKPSFSEFSKYQDISREFSILINKNIEFKDIKQSLLDAKFNFIKSIIPLDIYEDSSFGDNISLSFKIIFQSPNSTLKAEDIQSEEIIAFLKDKFKAELR